MHQLLSNKKTSTQIEQLTLLVARLRLAIWTVLGHVSLLQTGMAIVVVQRAFCSESLSIIEQLASVFVVVVIAANGGGSIDRRNDLGRLEGMLEALIEMIL